MKIFKKQVVLIWDFDGPVGLINSSLPYNFNYKNFENEIANLRNILKILDQFDVKCCFAITGFSAEEGLFPYSFPELVKEIHARGHEVASHSWRHEWIPLFEKKQVAKSLERSKIALEKAIENRQEIVGFVPPHNRPMTWLRRGAFSLGDRRMFPFSGTGDNENLIELLKIQGYKWVRVSYHNTFQKLGFAKSNVTGRIFDYKGILLLENHHTGFGEKVTRHILETNFPTYTLSAHPLMFSFENKKENKKNLLYTLEYLHNSSQDIEFVRPIDLLSED
jgi:peptidoglycan/xylan/chitin deacetylase (PgdA/CDA1 family)